MPPRTLYEAVGGADGVLRLAHAWHERVVADAIVAHAFEHGVHPQHTERLAAYWGEAWGGPPAFSERLGTESDVVRIHSGNGPHEEMDRRAIACFAAALGRRQQNEAAARMRRPDRSETRFCVGCTARAQPDGDDSAAHPAAPARFRPINRA